MGKFRTFMNVLNEASGKEYTVMVKGTDGKEYEYDIKIIDSTHFKFRARGIENWAIPQHINQASDEMLAALKKAGALEENGRYFIE